MIPMNYQENTACPGILFGSKGDTLLALSAYRELNIPPSYVFSVPQWIESPQDTLCSIQRRFHHGTLAVRSSCAKEDQQGESGAGAFTSRLFVDGDEVKTLTNAINDVIASYPAPSPNDKILVQPMIENVVISGVIMTQVLVDGSPYYVVNYDDSGKVDAITGGHEASKTVYIYRDAEENHCDSRHLRNIINFIRRIEDLCQSESLDIEFCIDAEGEIYLLQVRPICTQKQWIQHAKEHVRTNINHVVAFLSQRMGEWPNLQGHRTILGVMPDWNPAEMIGVTPRRLASSLYRELITRSVWRKAREMMGYRKMPPEELMVCLAGRPFIDVRVSFNSFLPRGLDAITEATLIGAWLDRLDTHPHLHDKVEFEVAQTALDFCFDQHLDARYPDLLTRERRNAFREALRALTMGCVAAGPESTLDWAFEAVTELRNRQAGRPLVGDRTRGHGLSPLSMIVTLCDECRRLGTLPFSVLARHAFIAESLLRTAVKRGALPQPRLEAFRKSIRTVSSSMSDELLRVCRNQMERETFLQRYGHLRPSSYDILSPRYLEKEGLFPDTDDVPVAEAAGGAFAFTPRERKAVDGLLREAGLDGITPARLLDYARASITGREAAKFVFTRNLSDILELLAIWGEGLGLTREELSHLDIRDVMETTSQALLCDTASHFRELAAKGRALFDLGRSIKLGYLVRSPRDVYVVPQHRSAPNFVGQARVEAPVVRLYADTPCSTDIRDHLVCIENADPGFDWIFTRHIAGLVTMFGGVNSHMAIRCAEYGLPAAIGVGERLFEQVARSGRCLLNAEACTLLPL
jgi:hypothetical protein